MILLCRLPHFLPVDLFFFFNDTATTEIYTLSLHDALPIARPPCTLCATKVADGSTDDRRTVSGRGPHRSEEHTSELQSQSNLVCRLLLEKKKKTQSISPYTKKKKNKKKKK